MEFDLIGFSLVDVDFSRTISLGDVLDEIMWVVDPVGMLLEDNLGYMDGQLSARYGSSGAIS